ncbi:MAG: prepilin peptidase [Helicobacteraceae bacterium]|jgi:leader peptidase (prepilin peptidase)/N-methyltransferase|nr:prepilin peptidase [Helicobacteraceae bacterium]
MDYIIAISFGLVFGSFGNVVISRIGKGESVVFPASHCPKCGKSLKWFHNIPLLSYIFLGGKCAFCREKIGLIYPIVECATALLFCAALYKTGANYHAIFAALALFCLLCLSVIDFQTLHAPDSVNFAALALALFATTDLLANLQNALIVAGALCLLRMALSSAIQKEAMGEADIIVGGAMGALLGLLGALLALYFAALIAIAPALINRKKGNAQTPFIPFLAIGTLIVFLFGDRIAAILGWNF